MQEHTIPYKSLSDIVDELCIATQDEQRRFFGAYLIHAKWVWMMNFLKSFSSITSKVLDVDKSCYPYKIILPKDCVRLISVSKPDEYNRLRSLPIDQLMNTIPVPNEFKDTCKDCGASSEIKACINNLSLTKNPITISNQTYYEKVWLKLCSNGDVIEIKDTPVQNMVSSNSWTVQWVQSSRFIAKVDVKSCGCVKETEENKKILVDECGCHGVMPLFNKSFQVTSRPYQKFGTIKIEKGIIYLDGDIPDKMPVIYQTNGECDGAEIMVPSIAVDVVSFGILWRAAAMARNQIYRASEVETRQATYLHAVHEMDKFLNPIRVEEFIAASGAFHIWGSPGTGLLQQSDSPHVDQFPVVVRPPVSNDLSSIIGNNGGNSGGGTKPPPPVEKVTAYYGWNNKAILATSDDVLDLTFSIMANKGGNISADFTDNETPRFLHMAEPVSEPAKTVVEINGIVYQLSGNSFITVYTVEGLFRVYSTLNKTVQTDGPFNYKLV